uniref:Cystatin LXN-type domain-containing protein n=1 Tax=Labrus bergylta TaxID=56723 RepID=A0A3Q3G534_9LABR
MATGELNTDHYPAQRAAKVVQHYLNTRHGSPFRLFGLHRFTDVADSGRKYLLEISAQEIISNGLNPSLSAATIKFWIHC